MITTFEIILRLVISVVLGGLIGWQRGRTKHPAGIRTYGLVSLGSAAFAMLSAFGFGVGDNVDTSRIASQILVGVGFIGAGIILHRGTSVMGLTTAAALWVAAAIGMAVGAGQYVIAVAVSLLTFIVLLFDDEKLQGEDKNS